MRIGRLDVRLAAQPQTYGTAPDDGADDAPATTLSTDKPIGASGTINLRGYLQTAEYDPDLRGRNALEVYERMRNDGAVAEAIGHIIEPVVAALSQLQIEPASEEAADFFAAELCRCAIFDWFDQDWSEFARQCVEGEVAFGHAVFEVVDQIVDAPLTIEQPGPDGEMIEQTHPNTLWRVPARFEPRLQSTLWRWLREDGKLAGVEQFALHDSGDYERVEIPAEKLLVFTLRKEGDNYTGRSMLRAAYKPWYLKDVVEKTMVVAVDRHGVGVPIAFMPASRADDTDLEDRLEDMLVNMRASEYGYAVFPVPEATSTKDGITFRIVTPEGGLPLGLVDMAEYFRGDVKAAVLTRFSELGHASVGARSVGEVQTEVWHRALEAVSALVCGVLRRRFEQIVAENLPGARCPHITAGMVEAKSLTEFATAVAAVVSSGAVIADKSWRAWTRKELGGPDEDDGTDEQALRESEQGKQFPNDPNPDPETPPAAGAKQT